jgi:hypothetical protein
MANDCQAEFPWHNLAVDSFEGTSPVDSPARARPRAGGSREAAPGAGAPRGVSVEACQSNR